MIYTNHLSVAFAVILMMTTSSICLKSTYAYSINPNVKNHSINVNSDRRVFLTQSSVALATLFVAHPQPVLAAPEILNTPAGVKYAITKPPKDKNAPFPQQGDIVAIEYTGYLANGQIFDATHAEGKNNNLLFKLGTSVVIPGLNDLISNMRVGTKVQAIIPPQLAFGDVGVCLEDKSDECLIKPGATLVYDVYLKKSSIPPP